MLEQLQQHWVELVIAIITLIGGAFIVIKIRSTRVKKKYQDESNAVVQSGNIAGGDIVGRDKIEK